MKIIELSIIFTSKLGKTQNRNRLKTKFALNAAAALVISVTGVFSQQHSIEPLVDHSNGAAVSF